MVPILSSVRAMILCISALTLTGAGSMYEDGEGNKAEKHSGARSKKQLFSIFDGEVIVTSIAPSATIPFSRAGNLIIIRAKIDTTEGNFILDTGAPGLVLNTTYFRHYKAEDKDPSEIGGGITGTVAGTDPTKIKLLSFGPFKYHSLNADRINLGHIENVKGLKVHGLLGMQLLKQFEMIIDFQKNLLHLHLISKAERKYYKSPLLADATAYSEMDITLKNNKVLISGKVGRKKLTFLVDTGAESNVIDARLSGTVMDSVTINRRTKLNGAGGTKIDALYGDIRNVKIGGRHIASMPVLVTNLEAMCAAYEQCLDGMLGFDFLSMHKIGFNFVTRKMYIWH